jgi:excisionase family DNA binding protein
VVVRPGLVRCTIPERQMPIDPLLAVPHLLEVAHVAHRLSASQGFVRRLIREKKLPAIQLGTRYRIDPADLDAFIEAQRVANREEGKRA